MLFFTPSVLRGRACLPSLLLRSQVPPSEYLFVDHTSSQPTTAPQPTEGLHPDGSLDLSEVQEFLSFLQHAFGLRIRFIRAAESSALAGSYSSSSGEGSSYLDLTAAALGTARGKLVMLLEADNILQPGCLGALAATLAAHPEVCTPDLQRPEHTRAPTLWANPLVLSLPGGARRRWWCPKRCGTATDESTTRAGSSSATGR